MRARQVFNGKKRPPENARTREGSTPTKAARLEAKRKRKEQGDGVITIERGPFPKGERKPFSKSRRQS